LHTLFVCNVGLTLDASTIALIYEIAASLEGHPDNVAPAIYGGIQIGIKVDGKWRAHRVNLPPGILNTL
jgi:homoserine kinase